MSVLPALTFAEWLPPAVKEKATELFHELAEKENSTVASEILSRLISDPLMEEVWREIYKRKRVNYQPTDQYVHPAIVTNASIAKWLRRKAAACRKEGGEENECDAKSFDFEAKELEQRPDQPQKWSEQDRGAQLFLDHAFHGALDINPVFLSDLQAEVAELEDLAGKLRNCAEALRSRGDGSNAQQLDEIANQYDDEAYAKNPDRLKPGDDPWIIERARGDARIRTFIADCSISALTIFKENLFGTVAKVTNVVFNRNDVTANQVREIMRVRPGD